MIPVVALGSTMSVQVLVKATAAMDSNVMVLYLVPARLPPARKSMMFAQDLVKAIAVMDSNVALLVFQVLEPARLVLV